MRGEIYVQLVVDMADNKKVRALARYGARARPCRDLYVQMILYCRRGLTDGHVPAEQVGVLVYPDSPKLGLQDAAKLVSVGLVEKRGEDYLLPGYLKRNPSRAEVEAGIAAKAAGAVLANHRRWHLARGERDPACPLCTEPNGSQSGISPPISEETEDRPPTEPVATSIKERSESTETETETETETDSLARKRARATGPPDHFEITDGLRAWATGRDLRLDLQRETERFLDHHRARDSRFKNWDAAWRTWMSRAPDYRPRGTRPADADPNTPRPFWEN